jgi:hypothetical protein
MPSHRFFMGAIIFLVVVGIVLVFETQEQQGN